MRFSTTVTCAAASPRFAREESGMEDLGGRGRGTVAFPEMRSGGVGICVATLLAGCMKPAGPIGSWNSPEQAWAMTQGQLAWYRAMEADSTASLDSFRRRSGRSSSDLESQIPTNARSGMS